MLVYKAFRGDIMKNLKLYDIKKRGMSLILVFTMIGSTAIGLSGCSKKDNTKSTPTRIQIVVDDTNNKIDKLLPEANDEIIDTATIMLLLNLLAKEDENGKVNADTISQIKSNIDVDNMINEFNSFLDIVEQNAIEEGKLEKISSVLPQELKNDAVILSNIEDIVKKIIDVSKAKNEIDLKKEYNKLYELFVNEEKIEYNGLIFEVRDLTYSSRAVANMYAETANYYSKEYISEDMYEAMNKRTNDQNNKAYIKSTLEILDNQMEEVSETDVIALFENKYKDVSALLKGKVDLSEDVIKNLINYMNLKYLESDKVAVKDMKQLVGEYDGEKINNVIIGVAAINKYNLNNQTAIIPYSAFLVDNYLVTETGKTDKIALEFCQYNSIMFINQIKKQTDYQSLIKNPYFNNLYKYFTKQDFTHIKQEQGKEVKYDVNWQEISDGVNFINYQFVIGALSKLPESDIKDNYFKISQENFAQSAQHIQNTIMDECKKVESKEYVKSK